MFTPRSLRWLMAAMSIVLALVIQPRQASAQDVTVVAGESGRDEFFFQTFGSPQLVTSVTVSPFTFVGGDPALEAFNPRIVDDECTGQIVAPGEPCPFAIVFDSRDLAPDVFNGFGDWASTVTAVSQVVGTGEIRSTSASFRVRVLDPIPEPSTVALFGTGTLCLLGSNWRGRKRAA